VLDEEIAALPERYRTAIVLCHLESKTLEQAARELGCPKSSLASRLTQSAGNPAEETPAPRHWFKCRGRVDGADGNGGAATLPAIVAIKTAASGVAFGWWEERRWLPIGGRGGAGGRWSGGYRWGKEQALLVMLAMAWPW